jgi:hypothetical protein
MCFPSYTSACVNSIHNLYSPHHGRVAAFITGAPGDVDHADARRPTDRHGVFPTGGRRGASVRRRNHLRRLRVQPQLGDARGLLVVAVQVAFEKKRLETSFTALSLIGSLYRLKG